MSLLLKKVSRVGKLIFLNFNAVNILIYCNKQEGIDPIFTELSKLENSEVLFNKMLDLLDSYVKKKVVLNKNDVEIIHKNAQGELNFHTLFEDTKKIRKYIFVST